MDNFEKAYNDQDYEKFEEMIHIDYEFHQDIPNPEITYWIQEDELAYLFHLFLGEPFENQQGEVVQPINSLTLTLQPVSTWAPSDDARFADEGCMRCEYAVLFDVGTPDVILQVRNNNFFYVVERDSTFADGSVHPYWQMRGQVELPGT